MINKPEIHCYPEYCLVQLGIMGTIMILIISKENRALGWAFKSILPEIIKISNQDCSFDFKLNLINNKRTCKTKCLYKRTGYSACCHDFMILLY